MKFKVGDKIIDQYTPKVWTIVEEPNENPDELSLGFIESKEHVWINFGPNISRLEKIIYEIKD